MRAIPYKAKHRDKTFIGRIGKGFDFLGYFFGTNGLSVVKKTIEQFIARAIRLCEQEPEVPCASARLGSYVQRWLGWTQGGLRTTTRRRGPINWDLLICRQG